MTLGVTTLIDALWILVAIVIGAGITLVVQLLRRRSDTDLARELVEQTQQEKLDNLAAIVGEMKTTFSALSREALSANTDDFLKLAKTSLEKQTDHGEQTLEAKKKLIDSKLEEMDKKLGTLNGVIQVMEKQRAESFGSLKSEVAKTTQATNRLHDTTAQLREALTNPQRRGQWGERMAEDVLRLAGFIEGVNYLKQKQASEGTRPDFTFMLPDDRLVHMDVKFPLAGYLKMLDAPDDVSRGMHTTQFLRNVRARVKEVTTRAYIDPASGTVDYVLVFIPNEQVYGFIHEHDRTLLDDAMRSKVVLCSPLTLYAILAVIRQSVANFRLEQVSGRILELLAGFKKQWDKYVKSMDRMGDRLEAAVKEYHYLTNVRTRQLDRQLDKIENLRADDDEEAKPDEIDASSEPVLPDTASTS
jgi:DNA recombination protein RmuC